MAAIIKAELGKIGGSTTGCMSRPSTIAIKLTGEETSAIAQYAFDKGLLVQEAAKELLLYGLARVKGARDGA